jgi:hypothetical protein
MNLTLIREEFTSESTIGSLYIENTPERECYTLEDADRKLEAGGTKLYGRSAIPRGRYKIALDWSPKYGRDMPHVLDVPGFEGIRIHAGNSARDTEGCLLVGQSKHQDWIRDSKPAFDALVQKLNFAWANNEEVWITII